MCAEKCIFLDFFINTYVLIKKMYLFIFALFCFYNSIVIMFLVLFLVVCLNKNQQKIKNKKDDFI